MPGFAGDQRHGSKRQCLRACCRRPEEDLAQRWAPHAWPSAAMHAHILAPLPSGSFPGVDDTEVYSFLERHADS